MQRLRNKKGFPQRTYHTIHPSRYAAKIPNGYWRSPVTQQLILRDLLEFNNDCEMPDDYALKCAISHAREAFKLPEPVKMLHLNDVFKQKLDIWNKSPGLPWRMHGYSTKGQIRDEPDSVNSVRRFWHYVKLNEDMNSTDCCAYVRSHIAKFPKEKVRAIWGYPATMTFGEAVFAVPLIRSYQKNPSPIAYGFETALGGAKKVKEKFSDKYKYAFDFKKFDKTVPSWLIHIAFAILKDNINFSEYEDHGIAYYSKNVRMFDFIEDYFINTPVRLANGHRYVKRSGVASGSYFTQLIDSIVNYILITWACYDQDIRFLNLLVLGDDSMLGLHRTLNMKRVVQLFKKIGMEINVDKSNWSTDINKLTFLGYKINFGFPSKDHDDWLAALAFPERPDDDYADYASRALGLLFANLGVDATFDKMCRDILKYPFKVKMTPNLERMLKHIGYSEVIHVPTVWEFLKRLRIW